MSINKKEFNLEQVVKLCVVVNISLFLFVAFMLILFVYFNITPMIYYLSLIHISEPTRH